MTSSAIFLLYLSIIFKLGLATFSGQWIKPFDNEKGLRMLCTDNNHLEIMRARESPVLNNLVRHSIMCQKNFTQLLQSRRYEGLVWFMQSMGFCSIYKLKTQIQYTRDFQMDLLMAAFSMVCKRTDNIGRYHLASYAEVFRIIYEKENKDRREICDRAASIYEDLYRRCHVDDPELSPLELFRLKCDAKNETIIQTRTFFTRFSRPCNTFKQFDSNYQSITQNSNSNNRNGNMQGGSFGQALANDTAFMNGLSGFLKKAVSAYSNLPQLVLKTRLLLQHFPLAAIQMSERMQLAYRCKLRESNAYFDENGESSIIETTTSFSLVMSTETSVPPIGPIILDMIDLEGNTTDECFNFDATFYENLDAKMLNDFEDLGKEALLGVYVEMCLLVGIVLNTLFLSVLLYQTRKHLSTATILFIFNILFSNALFVASFVCLFSDMLAGISYGSVDESPTTTDAALYVAETLQTHLYAPSEFLKNLAQETLFSLAQNGSLLGLTHLLVLVLVVINRSMSGKAIKLSRKCVITVFSLVWLFLVVTHVLFSALQYSAITNLDQLITKVGSAPAFMQCNSSQLSDFSEIGQRCDLIAVFHDFGVYLLRGHTLFTLSFLVASIVVFSITFVCHWRVRSQHDFLSTGVREHSPHKRRETLFNTLLLSLGAFFISVSGQSFIEIAVFWVDDRADVARLATWYQIMRIAAFVDPLLNPLLVAIRTPAIRRRLRFYMCLGLGLFCAMFCPWINKQRKKKEHRHRQDNRKGSTILTSGYASSGGASQSSRRASSATYASNDSEITLRILCTKQFIRSSILRRSKNFSQTHSVV